MYEEMREAVEDPADKEEDQGVGKDALTDGSYNYAGSLFLYAGNSPDFSDRNSFVYGHNMADGYQHTYQIFAAAFVKEGSRAYTYVFEGKEEVLSYLDYMKKISLYPSGPKGGLTSRLLTLSTCDGYEGTARRLVVQGIEIKKKKTQGAARWHDKNNAVSI